MNDSMSIVVQEKAAPVAELSPAEAQKITDEILKHLDNANKNLNEARRKIAVMEMYRGYAALGCESFHDWAEKYLTVHSSQAYRQRDAAIIETIIRPDGTIGLIPERVTRELAKYKAQPPVVAALYAVAEELAGGGPVTSKHTKAVVEVFTEALTTGAVTGADGNQYQIVKADENGNYHPVWTMAEHAMFATFQEDNKRQKQANRESVAGGGPLKHYLMKTTARITKIGGKDSQLRPLVSFMSDDRLFAGSIYWPLNEPLRVGMNIDVKLMVADSDNANGG